MTEKQNQSKNRGGVPIPLDEWLEDVPKKNHALFERIVNFIDIFCDQHLNEEYKILAREMAVGLCRRKPIADRGKPEAWACGIIYALGRVNFLSDPSQTPHMAAIDVARGFSISVATMHNKARVIRKTYDLMPLHPEWTLPSRLEDNPLVWFLKVNGMMVDIRDMPREVQLVAYEKGLIPYIPADVEAVGDSAAAAGHAPRLRLTDSDELRSSSNPDSDRS